MRNLAAVTRQTGRGQLRHVVRRTLRWPIELCCMDGLYHTRASSRLESNIFRMAFPLVSHAAMMLQATVHGAGLMSMSKSPARSSTAQACTEVAARIYRDLCSPGTRIVNSRSPSGISGVPVRFIRHEILVLIVRLAPAQNIHISSLRRCPIYMRNMNCSRKRADVSLARGCQRGVVPQMVITNCCSRLSRRFVSRDTAGSVLHQNLVLQPGFDS